MQLTCPICRVTDGDWSIAIHTLRRMDGTRDVVYRHRPCRQLLSVAMKVLAGV